MKDNHQNNYTLPSANQKQKVKGQKTPIYLQASQTLQQNLILENQVAEILANYGYNIIQNPPTLPNGKNPDYLIEGKTFDHYAPSTANPQQIRKGISRKVKEGQANRIILNLEITTVSINELKSILNKYPINDLREIIIIKNKQIIYFYP
jgi:hypothetical protein